MAGLQVHCTAWKPRIASERFRVRIARSIRSPIRLVIKLTRLQTHQLVTDTRPATGIQRAIDILAADPNIGQIRTENRHIPKLVHAYNSPGTAEQGSSP